MMWTKITILIPNFYCLHLFAHNPEKLQKMIHYRSIAMFFLAAVPLLHSSAQFRSLGIKTGVGATIVDVAKAVEYDDLEEWDTWAVIIKAEGEYMLSEGLALGAEAGVDRLYYWEYRWSDGTYSGTRWGTEWTSNLGIHVIKYLGENFFLKGGAGIHFFFSGGTVAGLLASAGYAIPLTDHLQLPIELRIEPVFGNATPIPVMLGVGIRYKL
jgi:hypothetical protein